MAHWAWMVLVEVRQGAGGEETRRGDEERRRRRGEERRGEERRGEERRGEEEEEQATDIKSNNPHLAGGEKKHVPRVQTKSHYIIISYYIISL